MRPNAFQRQNAKCQTEEGILNAHNDSSQPVREKVILSIGDNRDGRHAPRSRKNAKPPFLRMDRLIARVEKEEKG